MSGALAVANGVSSAVNQLYNTLLTATFGGVPFSVIDTSQEVGRRLQRDLFPGIDDADFQDLGADDGPISLRGLMVGDDYIAQMQLLRAVFRSTGPHSLVHPWLGSMQVVLAQRARMTLAAHELRVVRFEVQIYPYNASSEPGLDTLAKLETQLDALTASAENWLANAMAPAISLLGAFGYVQHWLGNVANLVETAISITSSSSLISGAAAGSVAALASPTTAPSPSWAATTAAQVMAVPAAIAASAVPPVPSAVAPGGATVAAAAAAPEDAVATLLAIVPLIAVPAATPAPGPALAVALQAAIVAAAVRATLAITYASQQDAEAEGAIIYAALDAAILAAGVAAQINPANAAPVWRDLVALKAAFAADLNALVGRLPAVVIINTTRTMPAWLLAQYISGDTPADVYATWADIVARNNVFHPALVPPGAIEVLNP